MLKILKNILITKRQSDFFDKTFRFFQKKYPSGEDAWGLHLKNARKNMEIVYPIYKNYFKVRLFGKENVKDRPYVVISNHTGQIAIDGMLIATAFATEIKPPRILRAMVERFFTKLPFLNTWAAEGGAVLGDRQNCLNLLKRGESVLVFPEGVKGVAKSTSDYYQLQNFTRGFFRIALQTKTPILPIAVIGAEETFPWVYQAKSLAKMLKLPALPLSLNYFPLPSPIDIHIGQEFSLPEEVSEDATDEVIDQYINQIKNQISQMTQKGLKKRRPFFANTNQEKQ